MKPIPVPSSYLTDNPFYQTVVLVVEQTKVLVTPTSTTVTGNEITCASGFILADDPGRCYTAAHNLIFITKLDDHSYEVAEPKSARVVPFDLFRVRPKLDPMGKRRREPDREPESKWKPILLQDVYGSVKADGFRTLAAHPLQQAKDLRQRRIATFLPAIRKWDGIPLVPRSGIDIAVIDLEKKLPFSGLEWIDSPISCPLHRTAEPVAIGVGIVGSHPETCQMAISKLFAEFEAMDKDGNGILVPYEFKPGSPYQYLTGGIEMEQAGGPVLLSSRDMNFYVNVLRDDEEKDWAAGTSS
jgi:hypothetical protein